MYKEQYKHSIILVKEGIFYKTYDDDALILWYLFEYKYINDCTSFGLNSYDKVLDKLRRLDLTFFICSKDGVLEKVNGDFDNYDHYNALAHNSYNKNLNREELNSLINKCLDKDYSNYKKIKKFLEDILES